MKGTSYIQSVAHGPMSVTTTERAVMPTVATPTDTKSLLASCTYGNGDAKRVLGHIADLTIPPFVISVTVP